MASRPVDRDFELVFGGIDVVQMRHAVEITSDDHRNVCVFFVCEPFFDQFFYFLEIVT